MTESDVESLIAMLTASGLLIFVLAIIGIVFLFAIAIYVLQAIALYRMAKKTGHQYPWMAWIPYANTYLMFTLPNKPFKVLAINKEIKERSTAFWIWLGISLGSGIIEAVASIFTVIPIVGTIIVSLVPIAIYVVLIFMLYPMYKDMYSIFLEDSQSTAFSIIGMIVPITRVVFLFIAASKDPHPVQQVEVESGQYYYY